MDWLWVSCLILLQSTDSCQQRHSYNTGLEKNDPIISVLVKNNDEVMVRSYNKSNNNELLYHIRDNCLISCEQKSQKYTLSWTQQADDVLFSFISYRAKKITINITLDRFDHDTVLRCTAFEDATLNKSVSNISVKLNNTQIDGSRYKIYPAYFSTTDPECSDQGVQYVIIDDLHNHSSMYPNDTKKICIHKDNMTTDSSDIYITRRVTYMNQKIYQSIKDNLEIKTNDKTKELWMAVGGIVAALTIFLIIIVIWKRKRKSSPDVAEPLYATAQEMNGVVYAELDIARGSTFSPNQEEVIPYAQVVGILKPTKKT